MNLNNLPNTDNGLCSLTNLQFGSEGFVNASNCVPEINMVSRSREIRSRSDVNVSKETTETCFRVWIVNVRYQISVRQSALQFYFLEHRMSAAHRRIISRTRYIQGFSVKLFDTTFLIKPSFAMPFSYLRLIVSINQCFTANRPWKRRAERNARQPCACLVCDHNRYFTFS